LSTATARDPCDRIVAKLQAGGFDPRPSGPDKWYSRCPAHQGSKRNLTVSRGDDGRALVRCNHEQNCSAEAIVGALGLNLTDLFSPGVNGHHRGNGKPGGGFPTLDEARRWMAAKLGAKPHTTWTYPDDAGSIVLAAVRFQTADGGKTYRQARRTADGWTWKGVEGPRPLYRLPELAGADQVVVCEGEKAADLVHGLGLVATTSSQGAKSPGKTDWSPLAGKRVAILPDHDDEGEGYARDVRRILAALDPPADVRVVRLPEIWRTGAEIIKGADVEEWIADGTPEGWDDAAAREALLAAIDAAPVAGEPEPVQTGETGFDFGLLDSAQLDAAEFPRTFLVEKMLVEGQPAIMGGPRKAMKTSMLVALALALASGGPFLGHFAIPRRRRVLVLSGESGQATIQETARRVASAMGTSLPDQADYLLWGFRLPQLSRAEHLVALGRAIRERKVDVAIVDPLYLCLIGGDVEVSAANMFQMGPLLVAVAQTCLDAGATPVLCHHFRQNRDDPHRPPELEDLAFAGVQEFARQWLLLARRTPYEHGTGRHELWLNAGGSAGHGGAWAVNIDEGVVDDEFSGRFWEVDVQAAGVARDAASAERDAARRKAKDEAARQRIETDATAVAQHLRDHGPKTARGIRDGLGWGAPRAAQAIARAVDVRWIRPVEIVVQAARSERTEQGYEHVPTPAF
jgi:hypothetical protein